MSDFIIKTRTAAGNTSVCVVDVAGVLDLNTSGAFDDAFQELIRKKQFKIVLNLEKLIYISSAGIGVLLGSIKEVRKNRGDIKIAGDNPEFDKVVDLLDLQKMFPLFKTEQDAVREY